MRTARAAAFLLYAFDANRKGTRYSPEPLNGLVIEGEMKDYCRCAVVLFLFSKGIFRVEKIIQ
ncbi:hypothetical protein BBD42_01725 [Paenibacillus sp. BIHB 4019]|uniref:Uncharacterized protein n=1 Tax=Paenibacillus sp. BIHB 4019 TaxID=1870819 RepID=A0A1B2DC92_9BACL|nr:hypothetical protein BBD42_01725 [Paenibacillus sp. BIHB 4019]